MNSINVEKGFDYAFLEYLGVTLENQIPVRGFYVPMFQGCHQVVDLGCGKGTLVKLLLDKGFDAVGVDSDPLICAELRSNNIPVIEKDVMAYLEEVVLASLDGIYAAHLIEHLPYAAVLRLIQLSWQALRPGGCLVLATPDPRAIVTHLEYYHMHFGHQALYHPHLVAFFMEYVGFKNIEVGSNPHTATSSLSEIFSLSEDVAVISQLVAALPTTITEEPAQKGRAGNPRIWLRHLREAIYRRCLWPLLYDLIAPLNQVIATNYAIMRRLEQALASIDQSLSCVKTIDYPFECFVVGHKL